MLDRRVLVAEGSISTTSRMRQQKRHLARTYRSIACERIATSEAGSLRKPKILFTHVSFRAPARVVAGIDAEKQGSRAGEAGASACSCGFFSSRESFSLLSEAAMSRFVGG